MSKTEILKRASWHGNVTEELILGDRKNHVILRARMVCYLVMYDNGHTPSDIARFMGRNHKTVSAKVKRWKMALDKDERFTRLYRLVASKRVPL